MKMYWAIIEVPYKFSDRIFIADDYSGFFVLWIEIKKLSWILSYY